MIVLPGRLGIPRGEPLVVDLVLERVEVDILSVELVPDDHVTKLHLVAGESAGFIGEDVLDLPELLVYAHRSALQPLLVGSAVHFLILRHEVALEDLHELEGDDEADGDEGAVEDEVGAEGDGCNPDARRAAPEEVVLEAVVLGAAVVAVACASEAAEDLEDHNGDDVLVDGALDVAGLVEGRAAVHHDGRLLPDVDHQPSHPLGVLHLAAPQHHILLAYLLLYL